MFPVAAAHGSFPTLSLKVLPWMLDPVPRRYTVCSRLFFQVSSAPQAKSGSVSRVWSAQNNFSQGRVSRMQIFRNVPASKFAHPPDRSYRCEDPPQGSRGFYIRAHRALLPPHAPDMLTVRIQAIDVQGLSPCQTSSLVGCSLCSADVTRIPARRPIRHPSPSIHFPVEPVIRSTLLRGSSAFNARPITSRAAGPPGRNCQSGILGPRVPRIAPFHLGLNRRPRSLPEARKIARDLNWPVRRREQMRVSGSLPLAIDGCCVSPNNS